MYRERDVVWTGPYLHRLAGSCSDQMPIERSYMHQNVNLGISNPATNSNSMGTLMLGKRLIANICPGDLSSEFCLIILNTISSALADNENLYLEEPWFIPTILEFSNSKTVY